MKLVIILCSFLYLVSGLAQASNCKLPLNIFGTESHKQIVPLSQNKKMHLERWVIKETIKPHAAVMATNISCQKLEGIKYTGSKNEWNKQLNSIVKGFVQRKATDISLILIGDDEAVYRGKQVHQEYVIYATLDGNEQVVYNITWLDLIENTALTVSVSGNILINHTVNMKYAELVKMIGAKF